MPVPHRESYKPAITAALGAQVCQPLTGRCGRGLSGSGYSSAACVSPHRRWRPPSTAAAKPAGRATPRDPCMQQGDSYQVLHGCHDVISACDHRTAFRCCPAAIT